MGGVAAPSFSRMPIRRRLQARSARLFAAAFSASTSLGWSTLVQIVEASDERSRTPGRRIWRNNWSIISARPIIATARAAAEEEVAFAESLCNQPQDTLIAVHRTLRGWRDPRGFPHPAAAQGGPKPLRAFAFLEVEGEDEQPADRSISSQLAQESANEGFLAVLRPSSARPRRRRRAAGHRRIPQGLSGAAGTGAAAGSLRGRTHAARGAAGRSAPACRRRRRSRRSRMPMRAKTGR